jgi:hypothetical protein
MDIVQLDGAVPDEGVKLSHESAEVALQLRVPPPPLVICTG